MGWFPAIVPRFRWDMVGWRVTRRSRWPFDPAQPTSAPGGSPEKVEVLAARVAEGLPLWHPDDSIRLIDPPDDEAWYDEWPHDDEDWFEDFDDFDDDDWEEL